MMMGFISTKIEKNSPKDLRPKEGRNSGGPVIRASGPGATAKNKMLKGTPVTVAFGLLYEVNATTVPGRLGHEWLCTTQKKGFARFVLRGVS